MIRKSRLRQKLLKTQTISMLIWSYGSTSFVVIGLLKVGKSTVRKWSKTGFILRLLEIFGMQSKPQTLMIGTTKAATVSIVEIGKSNLRVFDMKYKIGLVRDFVDQMSTQDLLHLFSLLFCPPTTSVTCFADKKSFGNITLLNIRFPD